MSYLSVNLQGSLSMACISWDTEQPTEGLAQTRTPKSLSLLFEIYSANKNSFGLCFHQEHLRATRNSFCELSTRRCYPEGNPRLVILGAATIRVVNKNHSGGKNCPWLALPRILNFITWIRRCYCWKICQ